MMRLLFLCLLLLPAATAVSEENEGSADGDMDDEDLITSDVMPELRGSAESGSVVDKTTGVEESTGEKDQLTLIVIVVAVAVLTLSIAAIISVMLVRRHLHNRQQGNYFVPTEQDQKGAV